MPTATHAVTIERPIEDVFALIADGERCPEWRTGVLDIKRVSGDGVGTRYAQGVRGPMGRRIAADYEITVYEPNRRIEFQTTAGPVRPHGRYDFEALGGGTRLTFTLDAELGGLRGLLMGSMVQGTMKAEVAALDKVKRVLESRGWTVRCASLPGRAHLASGAGAESGRAWWVIHAGGESGAVGSRRPEPRVAAPSTMRRGLPGAPHPGFRWSRHPVGRPPASPNLSLPPRLNRVGRRPSPSDAAVA
jgi:uncharacterized protein YndB with AHSA1/START domain